MIDESTPSEELMVAVANGDKFAFEILVSRHQTRILNAVYRFIGDRTEAEDITQEVFLRIWRAAKRYRPTAKFTTWAYRITANLCINQLKSANRKRIFSFLQRSDEQSAPQEEAASDVYGQTAPSPESLLLAEEERRRIWAAVQSLPAKQRMAVVLKRYEGLSYSEIAESLGCSVSAVDSLLVRAKRSLRKKLAGHRE